MNNRKNFSSSGNSPGALAGTEALQLEQTIRFELNMVKDNASFTLQETANRLIAELAVPYGAEIAISLVSAALKALYRQLRP